MERERGDRGVGVGEGVREVGWGGGGRRSGKEVCLFLRKGRQIFHHSHRLVLGNGWLFYILPRFSRVWVTGELRVCL